MRKDRRRESLAPKTAPPADHTRQLSTSSSHDPARSLQPFRRHAGSVVTTTTPPLRPSSSSTHLASNVAHSLLRGTQEGWSSRDDDAQAEALRKLDGFPTKTARTRASIGSLNRISRPGTPASISGRVHWDSDSRRGSTKDKELTTRVDASQDPSDTRASAVPSSDEHHSSSGHDKTPKKSISARLSFTPKRGSASSTTYMTTPTSSRDSASLSIATSATSVSASGRHSTGAGKARRNSAGSDISSVYSGGDATLKDRTSSLAGGAETLEEDRVPPVPPLPKDLSNYRSPPQSSHGIVFPHSTDEADIERTVSLEVPKSHGFHLHEARGSQSAPETVHKTPSKKWSFSNALNIKLTSSPSIASIKDKETKSSSFPLSPRSMHNFSQQLRKRASREHALSPPAVTSPVQRDAMTSAASLASLSSVGSTRTPKSPALPSKTPDRDKASSRPGTGSSVSNTTTSMLSNPQNAPLSPASSVRRHQSKRLTPSSIPFFRRSSSQSVHLATSNPVPLSTSPTTLPAPQGRGKATTSPVKESSRLPPTTPSSAHKKSSVLSLGLPSLLKSSSRRSLHADKSDAGTGKETRDRRDEKPKQDKERSESRISALMGRRRGKASRVDRVTGSHALTSLLDAFVDRSEEGHSCCSHATYANDGPSCNHRTARRQPQAEQLRVHTGFHDHQNSVIVSCYITDGQFHAETIGCFASH